MEFASVSVPAPLYVMRNEQLLQKEKKDIGRLHQYSGIHPDFQRAETSLNHDTYVVGPLYLMFKSPVFLVSRQLTSTILK